VCEQRMTQDIVHSIHPPLWVFLLQINGCLTGNYSLGYVTKTILMTTLVRG